LATEQALRLKLNEMILNGRRKDSHSITGAAFGLMKARGYLIPAGFVQKNVTIDDVRGMTRNHERGDVPSLLH